MNRFHLTLLACALAGTLSCGGTPLHIATGRPAFHAGSPRSYWIWHDMGGWHLRATTVDQLHRFSGQISPHGGQIMAVRPTRMEWNDRIRVNGNAIAFDFETQGAEDGFDWRVSSGCNDFDLRIDGAEAAPAFVHLGGPANEPLHVPFSRCR